MNNACLKTVIYRFQTGILFINIIVAKLNHQPPSSCSGLTRVSPVALEKQDTRVKPEYDDMVVVSYFAISSKQTAQSLQAIKADGYIGVLLGFRFGMIRHPDTGGLQHRNIVGTIAHRQHLFRR